MSGEMDRYFHSRRALKKRVDEQNAEITTLRGQIRDLQRTVAFFASVIKSGEGWTEQCDRAWPVTLEPCAHDFHRAEHGVMPCTKCGADAHADAIRALAPPPGAATGTRSEGGSTLPGAMQPEFVHARSVAVALERWRAGESPVWLEGDYGFPGGMLDALKPSASGGDEARRSSPTDVTNVGCERCSGTGQVSGPDKKVLVCAACGGRGHA